MTAGPVAAQGLDPRVVVGADHDPVEAPAPEPDRLGPPADQRRILQGRVVHLDAEVLAEMGPVPVLPHVDHLWPVPRRSHRSPDPEAQLLTLTLADRRPVGRDVLHVVGARVIADRDELVDVDLLSRHGSDPTLLPRLSRVPTAMAATPPAVVRANSAG